MPQSDSDESQAFGSASVSLPVFGAHLEALMALQPAEVLDVFRGLPG
jgi:hypothetical protein